MQTVRDLEAVISKHTGRAVRPSTAQPGARAGRAGVD